MNRPNPTFLKHIAGLLLVISVLIAIIGAVMRIAEDGAYDVTVLTVDVGDLQTLSRRTGKPLNQTLKAVREIPIYTVSINQSTVESLIAAGKLQLVSPLELKERLLREPRLKEFVRPELWSGRALFIIKGESDAHSALLSIARIFGNGKEVAENRAPTPSGKAENQETGSESGSKTSDIRGAAGEAAVNPKKPLVVSLPPGLPFTYRRFGGAAVFNLGDGYLFAVPTNDDLELMGLELGIDRDLVSLAGDNLLDVVIRIANNPNYDDAEIADLVKNASKYSDGYIVFSGDQVLGYPGRIKLASEAIARENRSVGIIELETQDGDAEMAKRAYPNIIRVHSISENELKKMDTGEAVARFIRAVRERNIRMVYLRPFLENYLEEGLLQGNLDYFADVAEGISRSGFVVGSTTGLPAFPLGYWFKFILIISLFGAVVLFFENLSPLKPPNYALIFSLQIATGILGFFFLQTLILQIFAFLVAMAFGILSIVRGVESLSHLERVSYPHLLRALVISFLYALSGGLIVYALLDSGEFFLKVESFRGVVLSLAIPALILAIIYWDFPSYQAPHHLWKRFNLLIRAGVNHLDLLLLFVVLGLLALVLIRSGNEAFVPVTAQERGIRQFLESLLTIRPRTKELIGYPALAIFFILFPHRFKTSLLAFFIGILAPFSVINTYEHLHTPIELSLLRTVIGFVAGLIASSIIYTLLRLIRLRPKGS